MWWRLTYGKPSISIIPYLMFSLSYTTPRLSASSCEIRSPTYSITKSPFFNECFVKRPHPASLIIDSATNVCARLPMLILSLRHLCPSPAGASGGSLQAPHIRQRSGSHSRLAAKQGHEFVRHCPALHSQPRKKFGLLFPYPQCLVQKKPFRMQLQMSS
jgi:hypothetical protein